MADVLVCFLYNFMNLLDKSSKNNKKEEKKIRRFQGETEGECKIEKRGSKGSTKTV